MTVPKITSAEVRHVASLAQLKLSAKEITKFQKQLTAILKYVSQLQRLKTQNVKPTLQTSGLKNIFRRDQSRRSMKVGDVLANAKQKENRFIKVKAVFEER